MVERFSLAGKVIVDNGSGTGRSALALATVAHRVIGVEPEVSMLEIAEVGARQCGIPNVSFAAGYSSHTAVMHALPIICAGV